MVTLLDGVSEAPRQLTFYHYHNNGCGAFCSFADICAKLRYNPVFTFTSGTGFKTIDSRGWFDPTDFHCGVAHLFRRNDRQQMDARLFTTASSYPGRLYVNTDAVTGNDVRRWNLMVKGYNPCDWNRFVYQYFSVVFEPKPIDCSNVTLHPAVWASTQLQGTLFQFSDFEFQQATASPPECASVVYCVVYNEPEVPFFPEYYDVIETKEPTQIWRGMPVNKDFYTNSPFRVRIKAEFGAYGTVYSEFATLTITSPCLETELRERQLADMTFQIGKPAEVQPYDGFKDSVSELYSDQYGDGSGCDICAPQIVYLFVLDAGQRSQPTFAYLEQVGEGGQVVVETQNYDDVGTYSMILFVELPEYNVSLDIPFQVVIEACIVYDIHVTHPEELHLQYHLGEPPLEEPLPQAFLTPADCGQTAIYSLTDQVTGQPAAYAQLDTHAGVIRIQTDDVDLGGTYYLVLNVRASGQSTATPVDVIYKVTIDVCSRVVVVIAREIGDIEYSTNMGAITIPTPFESPVRSCSLTYYFSVEEVQGQPFDSAIFSFESSSGTTTFETANRNYVGFTFKVTLQAEITDVPASGAFVPAYITINNGCKNLKVNPPQLVDTSPFEFPLWQLTFKRFNYATLDPANADQQEWYNCGILRYDLVDAQTGLEVDENVFSLDLSSAQRLKLRGVVPRRRPWLFDQPFTFQIKVRLGSQSYVTVFSEPFDVIITDPCKQTSLISREIGPLIYEYDDQVKTVIISAIQDTISKRYSEEFGNGSGYDLCGPPSYELFERISNQLVTPEYVTISTRSGVLEVTTTPAEQYIGVHNMVLDCFFDDYPARLKVDFLLEITGCEITTLTIDSPSASSYIYDIQQPPNLLRIPLPSYTVVPSDCEFGDRDGLFFRIEQEPSQSPQVQLVGDFLEVQTNDPNDFGALTVKLTLEPANPSPVDPVSVTYSIDLRRCKLDQISTTTIISDFDYPIGQGDLSIGPNLRNDFSECPISFLLSQEGRPAGEYDTRIFSFSRETGVLTINDNGVGGLTNQSYLLQLRGTASSSFQSDFQAFTVTFINLCDKTTLTPPRFQEQRPVQAYLWKETDIFFNLPTAQPDNCASFTYRLYESVTGLEIDPSLFIIRVDVSIPYVRFTLPARDPWLINSPFDLTLEAQYSTHGTTVSEPIAVSVLDTCFTTKITPQNIVQLTTFINAQQPTTRAFEIFTDSVALQFSGQYGDGSGYDLCGPQVYDIREIVRGQVVSSDLVQVDSVNRILSLQSNDLEETGLHDMLLCVTLSNFGVEYCQAFAALVSDCEVTDLQLVARDPPGSSIQYDISSEATVLNVLPPFAVYTPGECVYDLTYSVRRFGSSAPLPSFLSFSDEQGFRLQSGNPNDFGTYQIELLAEVNGPSNVGQVNLVYTFTLDRCQLDFVAQSAPIGNLNYIIGTGPQFILSNIENQFSECPLSFELTQNGQAFDPQVFDLRSEDRLIVLESADRGLNEQFYQMELTVTDAKGSQIINTFQVRLEDRCSTATLTGSQFFETSAVQQLYEEKSYFISRATMSESCGQFSYSLLDAETGQELDPQVFSLDLASTTQPFVKVLFPSGSPFLANSPIRIQVKTQVEFSEQEVLSTPLIITVQDPCFQTQLEGQQLQDLATSVNAPQPVSFTFARFQDQVSLGYSDDFGDGTGSDLCGEQTYAIFEKRADGQLYLAPAWITLDSSQRRVSAQPGTSVSSDNYQLVLRVSLPAYGKTIEELFFVFVDECTIVELDVAEPSTRSFTYEILSDPSTLIIPPPTATVSPSQCAFHGVLYSWFIVGFPQLPAFVTKVQNGLWIRTGDTSFVQTYQIELAIQANGPSTVDPIFIQYELVISACRVNRVRVENSQPDVTYSLGSGPLTIPDGFASEQDQCPISYSLVEEGSNTFDSTIFSFSSTSAVITIQSDNVDLHLTEKTLILRAVSVDSGSVAQQIFTVVFLNSCRDLALSQPTFNDPQGNVQLYKVEKFYFQPASADVENCGQITYRILNGNTGEELQSPDFQLGSDAQGRFVRVAASSQDQVLNSPLDVVVEAQLEEYATKESVPLVLFVEDPCRDTALIEQPIPQLVALLDQPTPVTFEVPLFQDSVSRAYSAQFGDGSGTDLCGPQTYTVYELINGQRRVVSFVYLSFNDPNFAINVQSSDPADIGTHDMILEVYLTLYAKVLDQQFTVVIKSDECTITNLSVAPGQDLTILYNIENPPTALFRAFPELEATPASCQQSYSYQIVFAGTQTKPSFASVTTGNGIRLFTSDPDDIQNYELELLVTPDGPNSVGTFAVPYQVKITGCIFDRVEVDTPIGDLVYQVQAGPVSVAASFTTQYRVDCPANLEYSLKQVGFQGGDFDAAIFTFTGNSPSVTISTDDQQLIGQTVSLELTARLSQTSGDQVTDIFSVQFTDGCSSAQLSKVEILTQGPISASLYEAFTIEFARASSTIPGCGAISYEVIDLATGEPLNVFFKTIRLNSNPPRVQLLIVDQARTEVDTQIAIRASQANIVTSDSEPFTFRGSDPCKNTAILKPGDFPQQIVTSVKQGTPEVYNFEEIKDSVSVQYSETFGDGTGFDICGPRQYSIFTIDNGVEQEVSFASLARTQDGQWQISVQTESAQDAKTHSMVLRVDLLDYGLVQRIPFNIVIDQCQLQSLSPSSPLAEQVYIIGNPTSPIDLPAYEQVPLCDLPLTVSFNTEPALPANVINQDIGDQLRLRVQTDDLNFAGLYTITVVAQAGGLIDSSQTFILRIQPNVQGCEDDEVQIADTIPPLTVYYLGGEPLPIEVSVSQSSYIENTADQLCPLMCLLTQDGGAPGVYDTSIFTLDCDAKTVTIQTDSDQNDLLVASLTLQFRSIFSTSDKASAETTFSVEIKNKCRDVELQSASWAESLVKFDFRNTENFIDFTSATFADDPSCDETGITYSLTDESGGPFNPDYYSIFESEPPYVRIRAPQGQYFIALVATSPYGTSTSELIEVVVADFCLETELRASVMTIELDLTVQGPSVTQQFDKPISDLEEMMNVPGICGAIRYELIKREGPASSLTPTLNQQALSVTAVSTEPSQVGFYDYILRSQSTFYPQLFLDRDLLIRVDDCIVTLFEFAEALNDIEYVVGRPSQERQIQPFIIQPACSYQVNYQASLVTGTNSLVQLPNAIEFIESFNGDLSLIVDSNDENEIGEYIVEILGSIDEGPQAGTASSFRFTVVVSPDDAIVENTPPIFLEDLPPIIEATAGKDEFTFNLDIPQTFDAEDDEVDISFDFNGITGFLRYDQSSSRVVPDRQGGANFDFIPTGTSVITVTLTDDNPTGSLSSFYSVLVRIKAKTVDPKPPDVCIGDECCDNPPCLPPICSGLNPQDECCENPPCPCIKDCCLNPPCDTEPVANLPADPGLISDITNTGEIVINLDSGFNLNQVLDEFENPQRRRALQANSDLKYVQLAQTGCNRRMRMLQAMEAAIQTSDLVTVDLLASPESNPDDLEFTWELIDAEDGKIRVKVDFVNPRKVSSTINNDKIRITVRDPNSFMDPPPENIKKPTVIIQDIVRQIDVDVQEVQTLTQVTYIFQVVWVIVGVSSFVYFLILTGGKEDPYLWSFLQTMQLLTHIQLINVKIPGNAALFFNLNNQLFRYDFFPNEWVATLFDLPLKPSPIPEFIQIRYLQVHMLMHTIFIFVCIAVVVFLIVSLPIMRRCSPKTAASLSTFLFWGVPIRMIFEFYFILALTSWHNLLEPESNSFDFSQYQSLDASKVTAVVVLIVLFGFLSYLYYLLALALGVRSENQRDRNKQVQQLFLFVQRPLRLKRYKPSKFIQPVYYLTRRMILALVCVFLNHKQTGQWLVWLVFSLGQLFVLAKLEPFGDRWMNNVQFINEFFIFTALIMLMPLANNLNDLIARDHVGWCLYGVLVTCIIFNILILLIRSCSIFCEYFSARKEIVQIVKQVKLPKVDTEIENSNPFIDRNEQRGPRRNAPLVRDHARFGMISGKVQGSLTSLYGDQKDYQMNPESQQSFEKPPAKDEKPKKDEGKPKKPDDDDDDSKPKKSGNRIRIVHQPTLTPDIDEPSRVPDPVSESTLYREMPREPSHAETVPPRPDISQPVQEAYLEEGLSLRPAVEELLGFSVNNELIGTDAWNDQMPDLDAWDLEPLVEGITLPTEPESASAPTTDDLIRDAEIVYWYCHENRFQDKKPQKEAKNTHTITHVKEIVYVNTETKVGREDGSRSPEFKPDGGAGSSRRQHLQEHSHDDKDHDCPVCNAAKPKKPTVAQLNSMAGSSIQLRSISSNEHDVPQLEAPRADAGGGFQDRTMYTVNQGKSMIQDQSEWDHNSMQQQQESWLEEDKQDTSQFKRDSADLTLLHTNTFVTTNEQRMLQVNERGRVYRETETTRRVRVMNAAAGNIDERSPSAGREQQLFQVQQQQDQLEERSGIQWSDAGGMQDPNLDVDYSYEDNLENAWTRMQNKNERIEMLEDVDGDSNSQINHSQMSGFGERHSAALDDKYLGGQFGGNSSETNIMVSQETQDFNIQASVDLQHHRNSEASDNNVILASLNQVEPGIRAEATRLQQVQRELRTQADQLEHEKNPTQGSLILDIPDPSRDSLFKGNQNKYF